jgi:hypothetical protein
MCAAFLLCMLLLFILGLIFDGACMPTFSSQSGSLFGLWQYPAMLLGTVQLAAAAMCVRSAAGELKKAQRREVHCFRFQFWGIGRDLYVKVGQRRYDCLLVGQSSCTLYLLLCHRTAHACV